VKSVEVVIIGAGPAGLTAAYQLAKAGHASVVLEADSVVGGISRTVERDGCRLRLFQLQRPTTMLQDVILHPFTYHRKGPMRSRLRNRRGIR